MYDREFGTWKKSSKSSGNDNCVEVAATSEGIVGMRDSKDRQGPILRFPADEWAKFMAGVRGGEFDI